jgi:hypothetical protein
MDDIIKDTFYDIKEAILTRSFDMYYCLSGRCKNYHNEDKNCHLKSDISTRTVIV